MQPENSNSTVTYRQSGFDYVILEKPELQNDICYTFMTQSGKHDRLLSSTFSYKAKCDTEPSRENTGHLLDHNPAGSHAV